MGLFKRSASSAKFTNEEKDHVRNFTNQHLQRKIGTYVEIEQLYRTYISGHGMININYRRFEALVKHIKSLRFYENCYSGSILLDASMKQEETFEPLETAPSMALPEVDFPQRSS